MGSTILITGTSSGVGLAIAKHFIAMNWNVVGMSRSCNDSLLDEVLYRHLYVDIQDARTVKDSISALDVTIDMLVNNAAVFSMAEFTDTSLLLIDRVFDVNVKGAMYVTHAALPFMKTGSRIVFINSVAGVEEIHAQSVYCASKHALTAFAGVLGKELRTKGIKVSSLHPGGINTALWNVANPYPCGDVCNAIDPYEIAKLIQFIHESAPGTEYKTITLFPTIETH